MVSRLNLSSGERNIFCKNVLYLAAGFFLKATLWPDFTELFFRFFGLKLVIFNLTSAKNAMAFWILLAPKKWFLSCLVTLSDQLTPKLQNAFDIWLFTQQLNWIDTKFEFGIKLSSIWSQDWPTFITVEVWSFIKRFAMASINLGGSSVRNRRIWRKSDRK